MGREYLGGRLFSNARVVIFDFLVSFSIVTIEPPHISALRYSGANQWSFLNERCKNKIAYFPDKRSSGSL